MLDTSANIQALADVASAVDAEEWSTDVLAPIPVAADSASTVAWSHWTEAWRLMPNKAQHQRLQRALDVTRELYNAALEERFTKLSCWHQTGKFRPDMQPVVDPVTGKKRYPPNPYFPSSFDGHKDLTEIRADGHALADYPVTLGRGVINRADRAFKSFYARKSSGKAGGRPRFKPANRWRTLEFSSLNGVRLVPVSKSDVPPNNSGDGALGNDGAAGGVVMAANGNRRVRGATHLLVFKPVGALRVHAHRSVPEGAVLTGVRLVRKADGIWEAHLGFKVRRADGLDMSLLEPTFGTDWNIGSLAVGSDGSTLPNPRLGVKARKARRPQERLVARSKRGSKSRTKKVQRLAVLREREKDSRRTHLHTASKHFVEAVVAKGHQAMAIEDTDVAGLMAKTISAFHLDGSRQIPDGSRKESSTTPPWETRSGQRTLKRSLADASIGKLITYTCAKAERAGLGVVKVAAHGTTQTCARCGTKSPTKITLEDRVFACACGWRCDRDVNAALNVLRRGRGKLDAKPSAKAPWATPTGHPALEVLAFKAQGANIAANNATVPAHPSYRKTGGARTAGIRRTSAARQTGA